MQHEPDHAAVWQHADAEEHADAAHGAAPPRIGCLSQATAMLRGTPRPPWAPGFASPSGGSVAWCCSNHNLALACRHRDTCSACPPPLSAKACLATTACRLGAKACLALRVQLPCMWLPCRRSCHKGRRQKTTKAMMTRLFLRCPLQRPPRRGHAPQASHLRNNS